MGPLCRKLMLALGLGLVAAAQSARSDAFPYVVRKGDSVGQIAERMYGRIELERVLVAANGLDPRSSETRAGGVVAGMRLEVPAAAHHTVATGESWASIAAEWLGGAERGDVLARLNGENPWAPPAAGRELIIPFNLRYVASQGDTTDSIAYRFRGKRDEAWLVAAYNGVSLPLLNQGQVLLVPLTDLPLTAAGRNAARAADAASKSEAEGHARASQDRAAQQIAELLARVRRGAYVEAIALGAGLVGAGDLTDAQSARSYALLTESYAALGAVQLAGEACSHWREHEPKLDLDPLRYSPKIRDACAGAGGGGQTNGGR